MELLHPNGLNAFTAGRAMPREWSARVLMQLARSVHYAHENGIVLNCGIITYLLPRRISAERAV